MQPEDKRGEKKGNSEDGEEIVAKTWGKAPKVEEGEIDRNINNQSDDNEDTERETGKTGGVAYNIKSRESKEAETEKSPELIFGIYGALPLADFFKRREEANDEIAKSAGNEEGGNCTDFGTNKIVDEGLLPREKGDAFKGDRRAGERSDDHS